MASSQVEIASSSPLGGCVLRDSSNRREQWRRESKARAAARAAFQKNLKDLFIKDHQFHSSSSSSPCIISNSNHLSDENSLNPQIHNSTQQHHHHINNNKKIDRWARAREMALSHSDDVSVVGPGPGGGGGGVSSLVRRWRDLAEESTKLNRSNPPPPPPGSTSTCYHNENACESVYERLDTPSSITSTDSSSSSSFTDWESDRTTPTGVAPPPPPSSRDDDARETERIRVSDIIKKLKLSVANDNAQEQSFVNESLPRVHTLSDQTEHNRGFSPRIRGRQAFSDLLMQMERSRHTELQGLVERRAVSKFQQRGRIQSLLRLRFLRREATVGGNEHSNSAASGSNNRVARGSTITLLRERFNTGVENDTTNLKSPRGEVVNNTLNVEISYTSSNQILRENIQHQEATKFTTDRQISYRTEDHLHEEVNSSSPLGSVSQRSSHEVEKNLEETSRSDENRNNRDDKVTSLNVNSKEQEGISNNMQQQQQLVRTDREWESEISGGGQGGRWGEQDDCLSVLSQPQSDWEMQDTNEQQQLVDNNIDWINDISRPRSDWEGLRQARYQEMLDPCSENEDVRKLLERRSVSTFLSSNLRETMDQLMISHGNSIQRPPPPHIDSPQEEEEGLRERMAQFTMSSGTERHTEAMDSHQQDVEEPEDDYEEEEESLIGGDGYSQNGDYFDQYTPSSTRQHDLPSLTSPWRSNRDQEVSDDSDPPLSPSLGQPSSSQCSYHPSIEMELIYDLRRHMEQLHHEMSELRITINSCIMSMQVKLQRSIKQEVAAAVTHSAGGESKKSVNSRRRRGAPTSRTKGGGSCCVCYEKQVDSILYRCGHMCTCFKCAHELQWSSGKCPICRAPIVDAVRAYTGSEYR